MANRPVRLVLGLAALLCAVPAQGQQAKPAAKVSAVKRSPAPRIHAAARPPVEAIEARGANPRGPFAKISTVQRDSIIENSRSLLGIKYKKWFGTTPGVQEQGSTGTQSPAGSESPVSSEGGR